MQDVEISAPLKYSSYFWRTLEMPLINGEINLILIWLAHCIIANSTCAGIFIKNLMLITLSAQDNAKLLQ